MSNYTDGVSVAASTVVALDAQGRVCLSSHAEMLAVFDVTGYVPAGSSLELGSPQRMLDTRQEPRAVTVDGGSQGVGMLAADQVIEVPVAGRGGLAEDATTAFVTATAVAPLAAGYLTLFDCETRPVASTVNYEPGQTVPNGQMVKLSASGSVCLYAKSATHAVLDVSASLSHDTDGLVTFSPERIWDSRPGGATVDGANSGDPGRVPAGQTIVLDVAGRGSVAADATAAFLNVAIVNPEAATYATLFPCGQRPTASNVNQTTPGQNRANGVYVKLSPEGTVCLYTLANSDFVIDANGFTRKPN